nr:DUF423 domain-containing protein [Alsobacter ponti]
MLGASGVALSAAAAHRGGPNAVIAAQFLLFHAPALLAIACALRVGLLRPSLGLASGVLITVGVVAFSGALAISEFLGLWRATMLAPTGGTTAILGWLLLIVAAFAARRA